MSEEGKSKYENPEEQKNLQDKIRQNLENILNNSGLDKNKDKFTTPGAQAYKAASQSMDPDGDGGNLPGRVAHPNTAPAMDFHKARAQFEKEARKTIKAVIGFYCDQKIIKKDEYLQWKRHSDEMTLSAIMSCLEFTQWAIIKMLEEIDMGNMHPRNFEVLSTLNNQLMSAVKSQAAFMITLEEGYKKIQYDHNVIETQKQQQLLPKDPDPQTMEPIDGPIKARGTKGLMQTIRQDIENVPAEEVKEEAEITPEVAAENEAADAAMNEAEEIPREKTEEKKPRLTDPRVRPENPIAPAQGDAKPEEDTGFELTDDMF